MMKHMADQGEPKWLKAQRFERSSTFTVNGTARDVFPLLCPVREYEWLPGWECRMVYSRSGVAELDAVFHTRETHGVPAVWTLITCEPDSEVEYLVVSRRDAVVRLSLSLAEKKAGTTDLTWRMLFTATSILARELLPVTFSEKNFLRMMKDRQAQLNYFLANGRMITT